VFGVSVNCTGHQGFVKVPQ